MLIVGIFVPVVVAAFDVLFVIARVVKALVVPEPLIIKLLAVNEVAPVPPAATGKVPEVTVPLVPVYKALFDAVPTLPSLVILPWEWVAAAAPTSV